ncbi:MAG TPA: peptide chain release factor N(5)-glutamine methyltransferase [Chromatiaceae bacterium]|nr:peptide chain release factor N(5)-glutamine methyltransferase [Chromatiaceae bacterium]
MSSVKQLLSAAAELGTEAAADGPLLLAHVLGRDRSWLYAWPEYRLDANKQKQYKSLLQRRLSGEPLAYLTGHKEFWSLDLQVTPATLIPRPETELLVETALALHSQETAKVLDLGTGSGAIALALASERPQWQITATDISGAALEVATENARRHKLGNIQFLHSHWFDSLDTHRRYDLILSNPPYVAENDPHLLENGLPHEPVTALTAGTDGLDDLRRIIGAASDHLAPGGWLLVEHGLDQALPLQQLFEDAGFDNIKTVRDLEHRDRVTLGCYSRTP